MEGADVRIGTCMSTGGWGIRYWIEPCVSLDPELLLTESGGEEDLDEATVYSAHLGDENPVQWGQCKQLRDTQEAVLARFTSRYPTIIHEALDAIGLQSA